jgi:14-3-3 protein epsilon
MANDLDEKIYLARVAEQCERYDDMIEFLQVLKTKTSDLTIDERNLVSVAYKNEVTTRRSAWRAISTIASNAKYEQYSGVLKKYNDQIVGEMEKICSDICNLINVFNKNADEAESKVFFHKMKGDYYRYMAEVTSGDKLDEFKGYALDAYKAAQKDAEKLMISHPIRLGLALNFSVFYFEIMNEPRKACALAKDTFERAINSIDDMKEDEYKDAAMILQLLKDNITLWNAEFEDEEGNEKDDGDVIDI